jgi:DNA helicase-2/ATP-dependent DNA helicase PcrA
VSSPRQAAELATPVVEESEILARVVEHLRRLGGAGITFADYDAELIELRDAVAEARAEDLPPLVEQMARIQALAAQRGRGDETPIDPLSPYFGHLRLDEFGSARDVLLGKHTYLAPDADIRIVDWRHAPVSRMYYCYDEGDDYEEEFGGKRRQGVVTARRSVTVKGGELIRVACDSGTFVLREGEWLRLERERPRLAGGQGVAIRAEGLRPVRGSLGVDADGVERRDKHLPEISALLDREQFQLISSQSSGLIVVQGSAGSGKTTVGLHRIAYLTYHNRRKFRPKQMLVVVFNAALAAYVSGVLPALGVHGVRVVTFDGWADEQRRRHVRGLPRAANEWTPSVVTRLKKHPAMLRILDDWVDRHDERATVLLLDTVSGTPDEQRVAAAWKQLQRVPLDARRRRISDWLEGEFRVGKDKGDDLHPRTGIAAASALGKIGKWSGDVIQDWADLLTDREALGRAFEIHAPTEFSEGELDRVHEWCSEAVGRVIEREDDADEPTTLDSEDNAILLRLHQLKRGSLRGPKGRLEYDHLMVDEVQDVSALELAVLMETTGRSRPVTLAGDLAQRITREGGFETWDELLGDLGVEGARIEPLKIAHRSTAEVMRVAHEVLGPYAVDEPLAKRHGAEVEVHQFADPGQAVDFLGGALRELAAREPLANVAVISRHLPQAELYYEGLTKSEVPRLQLVADQDFSFAPGVEVTDVRQVKGLEFDYVVLVEVNADSYPDNEEARHLLHVGVTRAAHQLWICTTTEPSPLIPRRLLIEE